MTEPLLHIDHLSVVFGKGERAFRAVDQVSLSLQAQDVLAVVGESGSQISHDDGIDGFITQQRQYPRQQLAF